MREYAGNNRITSAAMQRTVNTIEEEVFSILFAYIHCGATDIFSMGPTRDYVKWYRTERGRIPPPVSLPVVGGNRKGSLESETVKYSRESHGTRIQD
jgi:hypothetical protein